MKDKIFVTHTCRFCGCAFMAEDLTNVKTHEPRWRACRKCCEERNIVYEKQRPSDYRTAEQNENLKNKIKKAIEANKKINSAYLFKGH